MVGVDTHRDEHALAIVDARTGALIAQATTAARGRGYAEALRFADRHARGARLWAVEGAGHYGAGLVRLLQRNDEQVHEVERSSRAERRLRGKDDQLDAVRAARSALAPSNAQRRGPGSTERRCGCCCSLDEALSTLDASLSSSCAASSSPHRTSSATSCGGYRSAAAQALQPLPPLLTRTRRARHNPRPAHTRTPHPAATEEAETLEREILTHIRALVPHLLDEPGVGPIVAAQLIVSWSHHNRIDSEAAFARLAGVAPGPASSGLTTRHRLSRGGDRQLNRALHTIVLHRRQHDPATRLYIARRISEGKTSREAVRLLKRYLARHLYRVMQNSTPLTT